MKEEEHMRHHLISPLMDSFCTHDWLHHRIACPAGGKQAQVGIVHNFLQYAPRSPDGWSSYYISPVCKLMGKIWSNEAMVEYFTRGVFNWDPPFGKSIKLVEDEKPGCDFIGINYYGR